MLDDRLAASDGGPGVFRTGVWGLVSDRIPLTLHVCVLIGVPWQTWPLPAVLRTHPPVTSTVCPAASDGGRGDFPAHRPGADWPLHFPSRTPSEAPSPGRHVDGSIVSRHWPGTVSGTGRRSPPPSCLHRHSNSDHAGKRYVLGQNRVSNHNVWSCKCVVNRQQIDHENSITGYTFSKPVSSWKPVNRLSSFLLNKPTIFMISVLPFYGYAVFFLRCK